MIKCSCGSVLDTPNIHGIYTLACHNCKSEVITVANLSGRNTYFKDIKHKYPVYYPTTLKQATKTVKGQLYTNHITDEYGNIYSVMPNDYIKGINAYFTLKRVEGTNTNVIINDYPINT